MGSNKTSIKVLYFVLKQHGIHCSEDHIDVEQLASLQYHNKKEVSEAAQQILE